MVQIVLSLRDNSKQEHVQQIPYQQDTSRLWW